MKRIWEHPTIREKIDMLCGEFEEKKVLVPVMNSYMYEILSTRFENIIGMLEGESSYCVLHYNGALDFERSKYQVIFPGDVAVSFVLKHELKTEIICMLEMLQKEQAFLLKALQTIV